MIYDLFDDDPSFELVGVLRSTRRVCVTIQDCVMSTENLERMYRYVYSGTDQNAIGRIHRPNSSTQHPDGTSTMEGSDEELMVAPH